jgi:hypothetical protein
MRKLALILVLLVSLAVPATAAAKHRDGSTLYVRDQSTSLDWSAVAAALPVIQAALDQDFTPAWGVTTRLVLVPEGKREPSGAWAISLRDELPEAPRALGYHDVSFRGVPYGRVAVAASELDDVSWTVVFTHELWELLADPFIDRLSLSTTGRSWLVEPADPVVDFNYTRVDAAGTQYEIADFVLPSWYRAPGKANSGPWDFRAAALGPGFTSENGYAFEWLNGRWSQVGLGLDRF